MSLLDMLALGVFIMCWLGYEPVLKLLSKKSGLIAKDLSVVRASWMREMVIRSFKLYDSNLIGHAVNSASFFASANLILIAAVAGALFEGSITSRALRELAIDTSAGLLEFKFFLILLCLARGFLNLIWSLRQMNYCAAAFGALPDNLDNETATKFTRAMTNIMEPAMSNFSQGVRAYYFSLAAATWLFGPEYLAAGAIGAVILLGWRQSRSQAAKGLRELRELLENHPYPTPVRPIQPEAQTPEQSPETKAG